MEKSTILANDIVNYQDEWYVYGSNKWTSDQVVKSKISTNKFFIRKITEVDNYPALPFYQTNLVYDFKINEVRKVCKEDYIFKESMIHYEKKFNKDVLVDYLTDVTENPGFLMKIIDMMLRPKGKSDEPLIFVFNDDNHILYNLITTVIFEHNLSSIILGKDTLFKPSHYFHLCTTSIVSNEKDFKRLLSEMQVNHVKKMILYSNAPNIVELGDKYDVATVALEQKKDAYVMESTYRSDLISCILSM